MKTIVCLIFAFNAFAFAENKPHLDSCMDFTGTWDGGCGGLSKGSSYYLLMVAGNASSDGNDCVSLVFLGAGLTPDATFQITGRTEVLHYDDGKSISDFTSMTKFTNKDQTSIYLKTKGRIKYTDSPDRTVNSEQTFSLDNGVLKTTKIDFSEEDTIISQENCEFKKTRSSPF